MCFQKAAFARRDDGPAIFLSRRTLPWSETQDLCATGQGVLHFTAVPSYFTTSGFADYDVRMAETSLPERRANV
jgi:hypothetical protein